MDLELGKFEPIIFVQSTTGSIDLSNKIKFGTNSQESTLRMKNNVQKNVIWNSF